MIKLYYQRRSRHLKMLMKYFRLVFNDHFIIALFFLFGALAYGYAQMLGKLSANLWWSRPVLIIWFVLVAQIGRLATLIEGADPVFLLPQSHAMKNYLRSVYHYSLFLAELMTLAGTAIALPFAMTTEKVAPLSIVGIISAALLIKDDWLTLTMTEINLVHQQKRGLARFERWLHPLIVWAIVWYLNPWLGTLVALCFSGIDRYRYRYFEIDWRAAVATEEARMDGVFRFFNLFTDVPSVQGNVKRRRWADGLIKHLSTPGRPWAFLYSRGAVRNAEVSGLVIRLTIIAMIIVFFVPAGWLNTVVALLFVYLVATQLMPFYGQYDDNAMTHLFPVPVEEKQEDFAHLMTVVDGVAMFLIALASLGRQLNWQQALLNLVLGIALVYLLNKFYFKTRIKRMER